MWFRILNTKNVIASLINNEKWQLIYFIVELVNRRIEKLVNRRIVELGN
jgi:hypothetical protein